MEVKLKGMTATEEIQQRNLLAMKFAEMGSLPQVKIVTIEIVLILMDAPIVSLIKDIHVLDLQILFVPQYAEMEE